MGGVNGVTVLMGTDAIDTWEELDPSIILLMGAPQSLSISSPSELFL
jgi:hypothetical protein